jgi:hypothetical protein
MATLGPAGSSFSDNIDLKLCCSLFDVPVTDNRLANARVNLRSWSNTQCNLAMPCVRSRPPLPCHKTFKMAEQIPGDPSVAGTMGHHQIYCMLAASLPPFFRVGGHGLGTLSRPRPKRTHGGGRLGWCCITGLCRGWSLEAQSLKGSLTDLHLIIHADERGNVPTGVANRCVGGRSDHHAQGRCMANAANETP